MNVPAQSAQESAVGTDYQSLYGARAGKSTFAQTIAQSQSAAISLTTAEGDLVTLSDLSLSYQQTKGVGWYTPASSGMKVSSLSASAEAMGFSVQGDLNEQELADITRLVGELTSIASSFFSGDYESAMTQALDFGDLSMGSVSSLSASFSRQTMTQTRLTSHQPLPAMADLRELSESLGTDPAEAQDYGELLAARWQQILKALDEMQDDALNGLLAPRPEPLPVPAPVLPAATEEAPAVASEPPAVVPAAEAAAPALPTEEQVAQQMLARLERLLSHHPKLTPFAGTLASKSMEKAAGKSEHHRQDTAKAFNALHNAFRHRLEQWFLPMELPKAGATADTEA